jgi:hypothetical protein
VTEGGGASRSTVPAAGTSAATDVSLREYVTMMIQLEMTRLGERFLAVEKSTQAAFDNSQRAIDKAAIATEKRFEGVNEFRSALADQASNFVTRSDLTALSEKMEIQIERLRQDLYALAKRADLHQGKEAGAKITWGSVVAIIAAIGTLVGIIVVTGTYLSTH